MPVTLILVVVIGLIVFGGIKSILHALESFMLLKAIVWLIVATLVLVVLGMVVLSF